MYKNAYPANVAKVRYAVILLTKVISNAKPLAPSNIAKTNVWLVVRFPDGNGRKAVLAILASICFSIRHIIREARSYMDSLPPPFFRALVNYAQDGSYSWHCPGHSGGVAFLKSPVGQMFHQFFGENMLRADVCNAVDEIGQLLDHTGPVAASELNAARIFNSDHSYFVTNGTSTSNKIIWHATVAPGDIVVVDRNCHKSVLHAIIMTGATPVFLMPTRNNLGIIGPIPLEEFHPENIQKKIDQNPIANCRQGSKENSGKDPCTNELL